ncbi:ABC transporter substrate-binding protein [Saccharopolyspora phatthalungensis]|uniref:Putative aliphatic sulfonates-binding protein n=1 Tax=Saccharopolyspora phatthalungensis TaxID=664693 RepID=A0A840Q5M1_9PSEU|nr:ABC transporter substrate-binding protein [Saccharopolyspora phatthalungensis]MBB5157802.1 sulfonate transport system substrate-binding protein [Saccharopolyspora phatthalungensis]
MTRALVAVLAAVLLTVAGCTGDNAPKSLSDVTLVLGDQAGGVRARVEASGAFKDAPYRVRWANFQGAAPLFEAVRSGEVDTAIAADAPTVQAIAGGVPARPALATSAAPAATAIIVPPGSPIRTVADLRGKHIVVSTAPGSVSHYTALGALDEAGLRPQDVQITFSLPTDAQAGFSAGHIDAWATFDPYLAIAEHAGARVIRDGEGINGRNGILSVSTMAAADPLKREALADAMRRFAAAWRWSDEHPDEYQRVYEKLTSLDPPVARQILTRTRQEVRPLTDDVVAGLQAVADRFHRAGVLREPVTVAPACERDLYTGK